MGGEGLIHGLEWRCRDRVLRIAERPLIMGILNVTPDSFCDGGRYADAGRAIDHALRMEADGADIIDVGGESTRPGAEPVSADEELGRVVPVIEALARQSRAALSVDTSKAAVARRALEAGAHIVNDVTAGAGDPEMPMTVRAVRAGVVLMHMRGEPRTMQDAPRYADAVGEVEAYLRERLAAFAAAGVDPAAAAVDPGIGFGKTLEHNLSLLAAVPRLAALGRPVVVGLSRKRFLGALTGRAAEERLAGSLAALAFCVQRGAHVLRVHDVRESADAVKVLAALMAANGDGRRDVE